MADNILGVHAREIFDSRGNPTVEVDLKTSKGKQVFSYKYQHFHTSNHKLFFSQLQKKENDNFTRQK